MFKFVAVVGALFAAANAGVVVPEDGPVNHPDLIEAVNSADAGWTAAPSERFEGMTVADFKKMLGVTTPLEDRVKLPRKTYTVDDYAALPTSFDSRTEWSECPLIGKARDQSACGSCWAFGSTEAFNNRMCIASKGAFQKELSAQDTASCCKGLMCGFSDGCNGGQPTAAWKWFSEQGVVTGAGYDTIGSGSSCWPYQLPICSHHVKSKYANCTESEYPTPSCRNTCSESSYATPFGSDKTVAKSAYSLNGEQDIMTDIMNHGPVTVAFTVYADFPTYTGGVYKHTHGQELGGHAVEIIGWGEDNGTPYWIVMNSWNEAWGLDGTFWMIRGQDDCGIIDDVSAGLAM